MTMKEINMIIGGKANRKICGNIGRMSNGTELLSMID